MDPNIRSCVASNTPAIADAPLGIERFTSLLKAAAKLPGKGPLATAAMLVDSSLRLHRTDHILLAPKALHEFGLGRGAVYRALVQLEQLGLLTVRRNKGQGPLVSFAIPAIADGRE